MRLIEFLHGISIEFQICQSIAGLVAGEGADGVCVKRY